ncbi:universal stress protein [Mucilaginibacter sp. CSA2-8R]|uniref:universal stress protein n=1 Tax=Mucilaginibacter sp. CSA2-8R TaxID=3141542 RepID=UPI00315DA383
MKKQLLVASDFSKCAGNALVYAMKLALILDRDICVIHAIHPTEGINNSTYNAIFIEAYYNNKRQALKEWTAGYTSDSDYADVQVTTLCDVGFLRTVISRYVTSNPVEMLVMGIMGSTGISGIVGSNTSMIVTKFKTPTLIIPLESNFSEVPMITLATDFTTRLSAEDVNALNELTQAAGSDKIQVLYVTEKPNEKATVNSEIRLKELLPQTDLEFHNIQNSSASTGILQFIETHKTDILCLVKHHHNIVYRLFTRSTVNQVMNKTVKAILVLHE